MASSLLEATFAEGEELEKVKELRTKLEPELKALADAGKDFPHITGDIWLTRVLRGMHGNVDESLAWYREFLVLREKHALDQVHQDCEAKSIPWKTTAFPDSENILKYMNLSFDEDSMRGPNGQLLWYDACGDLRLEAMLGELGDERLEKFMTMISERRLVALDNVSRKEGRIVKIVRVIDLEGSSMMSRDQIKKLYIPPVLKGTSIEVIHRSYAINCKPFWVKAAEMSKSLLPPRVAARFKILGKDYMQDKDYLADVGPAMTKQFIATNQTHLKIAGDSAGIDSQEEREGTNVSVPAGGMVDRILSVSPGDTVSWEYRIGKPEAAAAASGGFFSMMANKIAGSEVMFSAYAVWTDKMPHEIEFLSAKVRSAGVENGDAAEFVVDGKPIDFEVGSGVNVIAMAPQSRVLLLQKTYDTMKDADGQSKQLVSDIDGLPNGTFVMVAVKGSGAEELSSEAWQALQDCGSKIKGGGHWHKGYALMGTKGGMLYDESRGPDVTCDASIPTLEIEANLVLPKEVNEGSGDQSGSVRVERGGLLALRWSNSHSYVVGRTIAQYKISHDESTGAGAGKGGYN